MIGAIIRASHRPCRAVAAGLDEPMNGLDPAGMRDMRDVVGQMPERCGATVFLSGHLLSEVEQTVTHIGLMHEGRL